MWVIIFILAAVLLTYLLRKKRATPVDGPGELQINVELSK